MFFKAAACAVAICLASSATLAQPAPGTADPMAALGPILPPQGIAKILRANGFVPQATPVRNGEAYQVRAIDRLGRQVRIAVDARYGDILSVRPILVGPPGPYGPGPYAYGPGPYAPPYAGYYPPPPGVGPMPPPDSTAALTPMHPTPIPRPKPPANPAAVQPTPPPAPEAAPAAPAPSANPAPAPRGDAPATTPAPAAPAPPAAAPPLPPVAPLN